MDATIMTALISAAVAIITIILNNLFGKKKNDAEVGTINTNNNSSLVQQYKELDSLYEEKLQKVTDRFEKYHQEYVENLESMNIRMKVLEDNVCYVEECRKRLRQPKDEEATVGA